MLSEQPVSGWLWVLLMEEAMALGLPEMMARALALSEGVPDRLAGETQLSAGLQDQTVRAGWQKQHPKWAACGVLQLRAAASAVCWLHRLPAAGDAWLAKLPPRL